MGLLGRVLPLAQQHAEAQVGSAMRTWPSRSSRTFSSFKSRYKTSSMWMYSRERRISAGMRRRASLPFTLMLFLTFAPPPVCRHACMALLPARGRPPRPVPRLTLITQAVLPPGDENEAVSCLRSIRSRGRGSYTPPAAARIFIPRPPPCTPPHTTSLPPPPAQAQRPHDESPALHAAALGPSFPRRLVVDGRGAGARWGRLWTGRTATTRRGRTGTGRSRQWTRCSPRAVRARSRFPQLSGGGRRLAAGPAAQARCAPSKRSARPRQLELGPRVPLTPPQRAHSHGQAVPAREPRRAPERGSVREGAEHGVGGALARRRRARALRRA